MGGMNAVATGATYVGLGMRRSLKVRMCRRVATKACGVDLFRGGLGEPEYLGWVATAIHVRFSRTMAALAGHAIASVGQSKFRMRIRGELLRLVRVAGRTGFGADEPGRIYQRSFMNDALSLLTLSGSLRQPGLARPR